MANLSDAPSATYESLFGEDTPRNLKIYSNSPDLARAFAAFAGVAMRPDGSLSPRLQDEVPEGLVCSLERPQEAEDLTADERIAIEYADRLATDHLSVDAAFYDRLREHFSEEQIVELGAMIALCVGFGRLEAGWKMTDHVPEHFSAPANGEVTPLGRDRCAEAGGVLRPTLGMGPSRAPTQ